MWPLVAYYALFEQLDRDVRLTELRPQFRQGEPVWGDTDDYAKAIGIEFDCPGCAGKPWSHRIWAPFLGKYMPNRGWAASGSGYHDLTFSDHGSHTRSIRVTSGCRSHFNVTGGAIDFYGDSGHTTYQETPVTETTDQAPAPEASDQNVQAAREAAVTKKVAEMKKAAADVEVTPAPPGFSAVGGAVLAYVGGKLHQMFEHHDGSKIMVPVAGTSTPAGLLAEIDQMIELKVAALEQRIIAATKPAAPAPTPPHVPQTPPPSTPPPAAA